MRPFLFLRRIIVYVIDDFTLAGMAFILEERLKIFIEDLWQNVYLYNKEAISIILLY